MKKLIAFALALVLVLSFAACSSESDEKVIKVGASPAPHAEILEVAKEVLAADGWTLEIVEFTDYVLPNETLTAGEIDANYFQHTPYLDTYNAEKEPTSFPLQLSTMNPSAFTPEKPLPLMQSLKAQ